MYVRNMQITRDVILVSNYCIQCLVLLVNFRVLIKSKNSSQTEIYYVIVWSHRTSARGDLSGKWKYLSERNVAIKEECSSPTHKYFNLYERQRNIVKLCSIATCYSPIKITINYSFDREILTDVFTFSLHY
jgi:hypothetical protein